MYINGGGIEGMSNWNPSGPLKMVENYFWLKDCYCLKTVFLSQSSKLEVDLLGESLGFSPTTPFYYFLIKMK